MRDAIIIGGGISGLVTAYLLRQQGLDALVLEKGRSAGGPISSSKRDGFLHERGPNSLLLPEPWVERLLEQLGLSERIVETSPEAKKRYIVKKGRPVPVPASLGQAITTPLFSPRAKLGFLAEPWRRRIPDAAAEKETVADFVTRRMGREFLDYAIDPFVSGVYAGDPRKLILEHAFPLMRSFEREGGSIVRGALRYRRERRRAGLDYKKRSITFDQGLDLLPRALAHRLADGLQTSAEATTIEGSAREWRVRWIHEGRERQEKSARLLVCLPSYAIRALDWPMTIKQELKAAPDLTYPPVHSLALGFDRGQIAHPLDGFGMLVPSAEPQRILGALFSSSLFPGRAPDGKTLLTVMLGGARHPDFTGATVEELVTTALDDLRPLLGLQGEPLFVSSAFWPRAIPQYDTAFAPWRGMLRSLEARHPGLAFGGSAVDGIALGAAIISGRQLAQRAAAPC